jgi:carboxyl-terminal processing protease
VIAAILSLSTTQPDDFAKTWDQISRSIRTRYYAREQRKVEMDSLLERFGAKAKAAHNRAEFEDAVNQMIHDFKDSHFGFFTESDQSYYMMDSLARGDQAKEMPEFGAWFHPAAEGGGYTVQMVLEGSEASKAGLRKDDVVTEVDGKPFTPIESLRPLVGSTATLTVRRGETVLHPQVSVSKERATEMFLDATQASSRIIDYHGHKIGYFHLWTQSSKAFQDALSNAVYGKLRATDGFILDIRDGFGGRPEGYGDPFFRPEAWLEWKFSPTGGYRQMFGYGKPMVLLINGGSRSAKEILSYIFKKSRRAKLVGQTTAGNVLGTSPQRVNEWGYIEIPIVDITVDGARLEGKGVSPDIALPKEYDVAGKDLDLAAALESLTANRP